VIEITLLREITYHMESHSVTCHLAAVTFPHLLQPKLLLDLATPDGRQAELTRWLYPKIVYPGNTVTYLRNNWAVSWSGIEPVTKIQKVKRPNNYTTEPPLA